MVPGSVEISTLQGRELANILRRVKQADESYVVTVLGASVDVNVVVKSLVMLFVMYEVDAGNVLVS